MRRGMLSRQLLRAEETGDPLYEPPLDFNAMDVTTDDVNATEDMGLFTQEYRYEQGMV